MGQTFQNIAASLSFFGKMLLFFRETAISHAENFGWFTKLVSYMVKRILTVFFNLVRSNFLIDFRRLRTRRKATC